MTYYPGGNGQPAQGDHPEINTTLAIHMCCALLAFVFLFPIGASVALGHDRLSGSVCWYIFHLIFHIAGTIAVIMLATTGYLYVADYGGNQNFAYNHEILGTAVFAAAILQMLLSPLRPAVYVGVAESNARLCWFWTHRILGAFVLFGGLANVLLGPQMLRDVVVGNADTYVINGRQFNTYQTFTYVIARATRPVRTHGVLELYTHARTHARSTNATCARAQLPGSFTQLPAWPFSFSSSWKSSPCACGPTACSPGPDRSSSRGPAPPRATWLRRSDGRRACLAVCVCVCARAPCVCNSVRFVFAPGCHAVGARSFEHRLRAWATKHKGEGAQRALHAG